MVAPSTPAFGPHPARRGRAAAAVAIVGVLFVAAALLFFRASTVMPVHVAATLSTVAGPGEIVIVVRHDDERRHSDVLALLEELVPPNLAAGVEVRETGSAHQSSSTFGRGEYTGQRRFTLGSNDPSAVIGPWFDFDAFVENANFLSRTLFEKIDASALFECTIAHTPMGGGTRQVSRAVRVDGELRFEAPHDEP